MPSSGPAPKLSLRDRNRIATRDAIAEAAVQLAMRHGIDTVRVEDIAAEAGVALRTFRHYFANKYEALVARHLAWMRLAAGALRERPQEEPLWAAISQSFLSHWNAAIGEISPSPAQLAELRLLFGDRTLQGELMKAGVADGNDYAQAVAERTGTDVDRDMYPRLVAGAVTVVTVLALDTFFKADPPVPIKPLMREAIAQLSLGFPEPKR